MTFDVDLVRWFILTLSRWILILIIIDHGGTRSRTTRWTVNSPKMKSTRWLVESHTCPQICDECLRPLSNYVSSTCLMHMAQKPTKVASVIRVCKLSRRHVGTLASWHVGKLTMSCHSWRVHGKGVLFSAKNEVNLGKAQCWLQWMNFTVKEI